MRKEWYREDSKNILNSFNTSSDRGLTESRVLEFRKTYGENILSQEKIRTTSDIFIEQIKSPLIYVLIIATFIVLLIGEFLEGGIILFIIILNAVIGTMQEGKAQNTLSALKKMVKSYATVIREGREMRIPDHELVPGDIVLLKDGDAIGADSRIIETNLLKVNESSLTGESGLILKTAEPIAAAGLNASDQSNMVFRGTYVVSGLAKAVVVRTGAKTFIGSIAQKLTGLNIDVPLKKNIENLSKVLVFLVLVFSVIIFIVGFVQGYPVIEMFETVVAVAVSAIPESLPVIVTLVLSTGVWRMSKKNVLVKKMQAVEALGQAKVVALDKTGTITKNQMTVEKIFMDGKMFDVTGSGYDPTGEIKLNGKKIDHTKDSGLDTIFKISAFTSIAEILEKEDENNPGKIDHTLLRGDPTEASLLVLGKKFGYVKAELHRKFPQIQEIPFDMENKHHTTINGIGSGPGRMMSVAGSPETIVGQCARIWKDGKSKTATKEDFLELDNAINKLSSQGYRVLALAVNNRPPEKVNAKNLPNLTFVGFVGIADAIRPEVEDSVNKVRAAGMRVVMITGDHVKTATAIAKKVGIFKTGDTTVSGIELKEMTDEQLISSLDKATVFARVTPDDKMRVIEAYKKRGETIAMTGDGVNDALSLVAADLGVSMGKMGTEVAREASDIVLLDDDFGNIVEAAEEGRNIYWTVRKSVLYLLSTNLGELMVIMVALFMGMKIPLLATQIIWLNLVTDTFLVAALAFEPKEEGLMNQKFGKPSKYLLDWFMTLRIMMVAILMTIVTLFMFNQYMNVDIVKAWTVALTVLTVFQWYNIFNVRSNKETIFSRKSFDNKYILVGLVIAILLHIFAVYNPFMQGILDTTGLSLIEWGVILLVTLPIVFLEELRKWFYRIYLSR